MKQTSSANCALLLVAIAWPMVLYGSLSQMGDWHPATAQEKIDASRRLAALMLIAGLAGLLGTLGLAAHAYTAAKIRALLAIAAVFTPFVMLLAWALW